MKKLILLITVLITVLLGTVSMSAQDYDDVGDFHEGQVKAVKDGKYDNTGATIVYSEEDIQEMKKFLEEFYSKMDACGCIIEDSYIEKNVTAKALKTLKEYGNEYLSYDEYSGGQLAGCKIEHIKANLFEVCVISYMMGIYPEYRVILSVVKENGSYKIDTIEKIE